ncbi:MAG TPA: hypothetical protein VGB13_06125 [Candidatus Krumholzibacteria bacterium]
MKSWNIWALAAFIGGISIVLPPDRVWAAELIALDSPEIYELTVRGFEITHDAKVEIDAVGRWPRGSQRGLGDVFKRLGWGDEDDTRLSVYAWILDSDSREPVWLMDAEDTERVGRSRTLRQATAEVELAAGRYELYFYSGHAWQAKLVEEKARDRDDDARWYKNDDWDFDEALDEIKEDLTKCHVRLSSDDLSRGDIHGFEPTGERPDALLRMAGVGNSELRSQGFRMKERGELMAYALVEHPVDDMDAADFAWIVNLDSGEWVWDSSSRRGRYAGGSKKNRKFESRVRLDEGRYVLHYGSDDSHSYAEFNSNPPYDPMNWGITLLPGSDFKASSFELFDAPGRADADIDFSQAQDSEFFEQAFRLKGDAELHVYALGEMDSDGWQFYDYGWIADATTGETVWEMEDRNCTPAGGAEKNRVFDGSVRLTAGDYIVFYVSDDSHSYGDWNSAAPFDPMAWGIRIAATGGKLQLLDDSEVHRANGVLASLVRMRDHDRENVRFELEQDTRVEIYALGEGTDGEMYDYGWIRNRDTGKTLWEMEYRATEHAGGARKNRAARDSIELPAGRYELVYVTDGSHSFEGWNDRRPDDPMSWGITVRRAK